MNTDVGVGSESVRQVTAGKESEQAIPMDIEPEPECFGAEQMRSTKQFTKVEVERVMKEYGFSEEEARISLERRQVYGDPWENHKGIALAWAGLLQPWWKRIARGDHLPPHVVAMLMVALKTNRTRQRFHKDNFDDAMIYLKFAQAWQPRWEKDGGEKPTTDKHVVASTRTAPPEETPAPTTTITRWEWRVQDRKTGMFYRTDGGWGAEETSDTFTFKASAQAIIDNYKGINYDPVLVPVEVTKEVEI